MARLARMPQKIPFTRYVGPVGRRILQVKYDVPARCRPFLGDKSALTKYPSTGPIRENQPPTPAQLAEITGMVADFEAQIARAKVRADAASNPELVAADIIEQNDWPKPIYWDEAAQRQPVSRRRRLRLAQAGADQDIAYVAPALADRVRELIATHYEAERAQIADADMVIAWITDMLNSVSGDEYTALRDRFLAAATARPASADPVLPDQVIKLWIDKRVKRPPAKRSIDNKRSKIERLFKWLEENRGYPKGCRDFARVTKPDAVAYERDSLAPEGISRDHLIEVGALFNLAKKKDLITINPFADIDVPAKSDVTRFLFDRKQQIAVLNAARDPAFVARICTRIQMARGIGAVAVVRWIHWLAAFTSGIMSELIKVRVNMIVFDDEHHLWTIRLPGSKTKFRDRIVVLHDSLLREGFLSYVETVRARYGDDAPLFPGWNESQAGVVANKLVRELGIDDPLLSHYSWRHVVCTTLDRAPAISPNLADYVTGHAPPNVKAKHYIHPDLLDVKRAIDSLVDPTVPADLVDVQRVA